MLLGPGVKLDIKINDINENKLAVIMMYGFAERIALESHR
jgi:hypothetical protein